jgi:hypothetical protein
MVYLVTDSLPSFMRVASVDGVFTEKLNGFLEYSLVVIAEKDGVWFSATTPKVTPGSVDVTLQSSDESSLRRTLNTTYSGKVGTEFGAELNFMKDTRAFTIHRQKEQVQNEIDRQIIEIIFPFYVYSDPQELVLPLAH